MAQLRRREREGTDVAVSDLLMAFGAEAAHTLNHPGNPVLVALARRIQKELAVPVDAAEPGRPLLGGIRAPLAEPVVEALSLDVAPREHWLVDDVAVSTEEIEAAQSRWYATHPQWVEAGVRRHAQRLELLGL